jgi:flavin reductase (DIM6/NTAB) family NADH-FMN oxidoreductase RutF
MSKLLTTIDIKAFDANAIKLIGTNWMLIAAGPLGACNVMTAGWGSLGVLWNKPVATIFVRPQRHTFSFLEANDYFTLNFFGSEHREILSFCGSRSGKHCDKIKETKLLARNGTGNTCYFEQSELVLTCRKLYFNDLDPANFLDPTIQNNYPAKDYHRMYVAEIVEIMQKSKS